MTTANDFFGTDDQPNTEAQVPENVLDTLVGEGKKFKTVDDLARGKYESDRFIERVLEEQKALKQELAQRKRLEEVVEALSLKQPPSIAPHQEQREPDTRNVSNLTLEDLERFHQSKRVEEAQAANVEFVRKELSKRFGSTWREVAKQKGQELGLTEQQFVDYAKTAPQMVLSAFPATPAPQAPVNGIPPSAVNSGAFRPNAAPTGAVTWKDSEALRKSDSKTYYSKAYQDRLISAASSPDFYK